MEKTLVILKPSCVQRALMGDVISRFEKKGLRLVGAKMILLDDALLDEHYAHLKDRPFFARIKNSMKACPVMIQCWAGVDAIKIIRTLLGATNGREAVPGTIRGDFSVSGQENIVHASDSAESAQIEIDRFFSKNEIFDYKLSTAQYLYSVDEI